MPVIRKSADLRNNYGEISDFCHNNREPIFITKNGQGDLAVMSIQVYEELVGKIELYKSLQLGMNQIKNGETISKEKVFKKIHKYIGN
ncbi:MAG: type II toxin-antitoxin system Phd/YefM family antitoxin [Spirochaetaceae bacterium]|nr:type II toxin-antitoxin system Phd/YefM family antitoxin [Spirochaetaceae bacterium]